MMKNKRSPLFTIALKNHQKMTEKDRLLESGRKGSEFIMTVFFGPSVAQPRTYDRLIQESILNLYGYIAATESTVPVINKNRNILVATLRTIFNTNPLLPAGSTINAPDVDDVNVLSSQDRFHCILFLDGLNKDYNFSVPEVQYDQTSSSGAEESLEKTITKLTHLIHISPYRLYEYAPH